MAFLDILGFSSFVKNADDPKWRAAIENVVKTLRETLAPNPVMADLRFTQFSDCIVISALRGAPFGIYGVLSGVTMLSNNLLNQQVLLRGGVAVGNVIHTDDVLFGPGLLTAYSQDRTGLPPRVSADKSLIEEIETYEEVFGLREYIKTDPYDLTPMIHTLHQYEVYEQIAKPGYPVLDNEAEYLAKAIAWHSYTADYSPSVRAKWLWLERYWNSSVSKKGILPTTEIYRWPS